jgi:uncharacterized phage protein (TIGR02218 family)
VKAFSSGLLNFLQTTTSYNRADLFAITPIPQNMLLQSQAFQMAPWTGAGTPSSPVVTANATAAPDGTITAEQFVFPTTGAGQESYQQQDSLFVPLVGISWTFSIWLRAASNLSINLRLVQATGENDTVVSMSVTTGWTRFSMTITPTAVGTGTMLARLHQPASRSSVTLFAWGAQLEMSATMGPYSPTRTVPIGPYGPRPGSINAASSTFDIIYQGVTFYASKFGAWERGKITSEASFDLKANEMTLNLMAPGTLAYPNTTVTMMGAAQLGLFDAALVQVWTAYWPIGKMPNPYIALWGVETKFAGFIKPNGSFSRSKLEFEVADALYLLNLKLPRNVIQASCRHTLYDANCTMLPTNFKSGGIGGVAMVAAGSTRQNIFSAGSLGQSPPYFTQGYITMLTGQNAGLSFSIKNQISTTNLLLAAAMPLPLAIGDTFVAFAGCDKSEATCNAKFANLAHFGGQPFVPIPEVAI